MVSRVASHFRKPSGLTAVPAGGEANFLAPLEIRRPLGVGLRTEERLQEAGITTIGELGSMSGKVATMLHERAHGFAEDISDWRMLHSEIGQAENVSERLQLVGQGARTVTVKLRYDNLATRSRSTTLVHLIDDAAGSASSAASCSTTPWSNGRARCA